MLNFLPRLTLSAIFLCINQVFTSQQLTTFHPYTQLSHDLQISVIKKMNFQTIVQLGHTSASQRDLIRHFLDNNSLRYSLTPMRSVSNPDVSIILNLSDNSNNQNKRKRIEPTEGLMRLKKINRKFWTDMAEESASFSNRDAENDTTVRALQLLFKKDEDESNC